MKKVKDNLIEINGIDEDLQALIDKKSNQNSQEYINSKKYSINNESGYRKKRFNIILYRCSAMLISVILLIILIAISRFKSEADLQNNTHEVSSTKSNKYEYSLADSKSDEEIFYNYDLKCLKQILNQNSDGILNALTIQQVGDVKSKIVVWHYQNKEQIIKPLTANFNNLQTKEYYGEIEKAMKGNMLILDDEYFINTNEILEIIYNVSYVTIDFNGDNNVLLLNDLSKHALADLKKYANDTGIKNNLP